jgi:plastocyanin
MYNNDPLGILPQQRLSKRWIVTGLVALVAVVSLISGVILTNSEASRQVSAAPAPAARVGITATGLDVSELRIQKGQSVIWESQDSLDHELAIAPGSPAAPGFGGDVHFMNGQTYTYAFDDIGTFYYYDTLHPLQIKGAITVVE